MRAAQLYVRLLRRAMHDVTIWRYLDFAKYLDLISTSELFFCRSDNLGDPFEGSYPEKHLDRRIEEIKKSAGDFSREVQMYVLAGAEYRKYVYVNCWHMSEHESAALWRLYLQSNEGVAILSTRDRLGSSFIDSEQKLWTVPVQYIDYYKDDPPVPTRIAPFRYKRKSFEHEKELRAMVFADIEDDTGKRLQPPSELGIRVHIHLATLIQAVCVAPTAPDWVLELIKRVTIKYGVDVPVIRSSLATDQPLFI